MVSHASHADSLATCTLTLQQESAVLALLSEHSVTKAAETVGISDRTLHRWLEDADFAAALRKARRQAFGQSISLCQRYAPLAVNTLATVMADSSASTTSRVSAATSLLRFAREVLELDDLVGRIEALEARETPGQWDDSAS